MVRRSRYLPRVTAAATGTSTPNHDGRLRQLDGLRAVAIGLVVAHHMWPMPDGTPPLGFAGVALFFVISGFLITRILLDCKDRIACGEATVASQLWAFYARRALRIFPPYYGLLLIVWLMGVRKIDDRIWWHLTYTWNWIYATGEGVGRGGGFDRHLWSLCVEEQFYLLWPMLALFLPRRAFPWLLVLCVAIGVGWRARFAWLLFKEQWHYGWFEFPTPAVIDFLAAGGALAYWWGRPWLKRACWICIAIGLPFVLLGWFPPSPDFQIFARIVVGRVFLAMVWMGVVGLVAMGLPGLLGRSLEWKPIAFLGVISYGIYLLHLFVNGAVGVTFDDDFPHWAGAAIGTAATVALAALSWVCFEGPINRLKRFVPYGRTTVRS